MAITTKPTLLALLLGSVLALGTAQAQDAPAGDDATTEAVTEGAGTGAAEAGAEAAETETPAEAEAAAADDDAPQPGSFYFKATHDDWQLRCVHTPDGNDPCEMFQLLRDENDNPVAEATLIPLQGQQIAAGMTITAPLESDLASGVGLQIDSGEARAYPFAVCAAVGCISRIGLQEGELSAMQRGSKGTVLVQPFGLGPDAQVALTLSLTGFTAAYNALSDYVAEAGTPAPAAD